MFIKILQIKRIISFSKHVLEYFFSVVHRIKLKSETDLFPWSKGVQKKSRDIHIQRTI